jgi:HlyD family secretion protein
MLKRWTLFVAVLAGLAVAGWWLTRPDPIIATLVTVEPGTVESLEVLAAREGAVVKPGELLVGLWNRDLTAQVTLTESEARAALSNIEQACLRAEVGRREANRLVRLRERDLVAEESVDQAVTEAAAREAACSAARANAEVARSSIAVARAALERSKIRAPFAGVVAEVNGELGEYVTPSPPGIATLPVVDLVESGCLYVSAPIDEVDAPDVRRGQVARVTLDAFRERTFGGTVRRVAPYVQEFEKQARTVEIEVELDPGQLTGLLPGYTADVEVLLERHENALRIPAAAIDEDDRVLRYRPADGMLEAVEIEVGLRNWQVVEVLGGLARGERVALPDEGVVAGATVVPATDTP